MKFTYATTPVLQMLRTGRLDNALIDGKDSEFRSNYPVVAGIWSRHCETFEQQVYTAQTNLPSFQAPKNTNMRVAARGTFLLGRKSFCVSYEPEGGAICFFEFTDGALEVVAFSSAGTPKTCWMYNRPTGAQEDKDHMVLRYAKNMIGILQEWAESSAQPMVLPARKSVEVADRKWINETWQEIIVFN